MRTILITGSSGGIGSAIALRALKDGHRVSLGIRNPSFLKGTELDPEKFAKDKLIVNYYDAENNPSIKEWINNTHKSFGSINTVIHCAGIFKNTGLLFLEEEEKELDKLWRVNLMGPWLLTKEVWKDLENDGSGRIQVLVSMSGKRSKGNLAGYTVSKFGLMGLCQTMRNEGWEKGIRVTAICPGWVNTNMASNINSIKKEDMTQVEDIALISSTLLKLPNSSIPFEVPVNCILEKNY
ncbi:SDR family NAD(P)-dependent oxidoreductase [Prochlorococcus sp. MIT 1223]|uniref:SDR family NAD(P)-dependent oxidoreductase n=1 Tax=Prochlorococcus sp. MIT 1223 TaxID=3096217 RepID=UPI002A7669B6|nr:SDR family NAD(P)-dependent oxidoreductase [Prochlorococcus sp. MIT 1223]